MIFLFTLLALVSCTTVTDVYKEIAELHIRAGICDIEQSKVAIRKLSMVAVSDLDFRIQYPLIFYLQRIAIASKSVIDPCADKEL